MHKKHKGLFIAFWLTPETAEKLSIFHAHPGGEPHDELHLTLCYSGDVESLSAEVVSRAIDAVGRITSTQRALTGKVSGLGRFQASETSDDKDVLYASVDMPGLVELRVALAKALEDAGAPPRSNHGFTPHITLAFLKPGEASPISTVPEVELRLNALTVIAGDERRAFTLQVSEEETMKHAVKFSEKADDIIEGIGMPYGGPFNGKDLHRQYFSTKTDFAFDWFKERPLLYAHGFDKDLGLSVVGRVKAWSVKDRGVWVRAQLDKSHKYFEDIKTLIGEDALYFSSGSVGHLVEVNKKSGEIEQWPWVELTLTPQPANFYADLDFATAEKHCKEAGFDLPAAVKSAFTAKSKALSIKSIFERELAEQQLSVWRLWNAAQCGFEEVAKAASVSAITGVEVDVTAKVTEIVAEFNARLIPAVAKQITDFLQSDSEENFYLKAVSLDALINDNSHVGLNLAEHLEQVHAAVAGVTKRADDLRDLRATTKEGRPFSAANLQKLQGLHEQMGDCHSKMGELIEGAKPKPKEDDPAKSVNPSKSRERDHRFLTLTTFQLGGD